MPPLSFQLPTRTPPREREGSINGAPQMAVGHNAPSTFSSHMVHGASSAISLAVST